MRGALLKTVEEAVRRAGPTLRRVLSPIKSERDLIRRTKLLDALLDKVGTDEEHPLAYILDALANIIENYELIHHPIPEATPQQMLAHIMSQRGVKQKDLADIISQGNLSAFLNGKRQLTPIQIRKLSQRFDVPADLFLPAG